MNKMLIDRSTVEQALEALEGGADSWQRVGPAIDALKAALAEPAQEPYCYVYEYDTPLGMHRTFYPKEHNGQQPDRAIPLYTAPPQRPAEPQEPFALPCPTPKACKAHCCSGNCIPRSKA